MADILPKKYIRDILAPSSSMNSYIVLVLKYKVAIIAALVVVLGGVWWFTAGSGSEKLNTFTVVSGEFVRDVSVSGKVVAAQSVDLGFSQGGRVTRVNAKVGNIVGVGTVLAEVENGDIRANILQREAALEVQKAKLVSLQNGTRPEEIAVAEGTVRNAEISLERANQTVADVIREAYTASDDAVHNNLDLMFTNPRSTNPELIFQSTNSRAELETESGRITAEAMFTKWQSEVLALSALDDLTSEITHAEENLRSVVLLLTNANAALNRAIATADITQSEIDAFITDISAARTSVNTKISALTSAYTSFKSAQATLDAANRNLALKKSGTTQVDINAQAAQVKVAEADLANARSQLSRTLVVAPFTGVVTKMGAKVGSIASSNTSEISMVSSNKFQIESFVPEIHIALIKVRDSDRVTLDAYGNETIFKAVVASVDPAETVRDGVATYKAVLQFTDTDARIKSGMTANVIITTERKPNTLSMPEGAVYRREGKSYVKILSGEEVVERELTTGSVSSMGQVEILSGVQAGEMVVLETAE